MNAETKRKIGIVTIVVLPWVVAYVIGRWAEAAAGPVEAGMITFVGFVVMLGYLWYVLRDDDEYMSTDETNVWLDEIDDSVYDDDDPEG
jgi:hypothetical protein